MNTEESARVKTQRSTGQGPRLSASVIRAAKTVELQPALVREQAVKNLL